MRKKEEEMKEDGVEGEREAGGRQRGRGNMRGQGSVCQGVDANCCNVVVVLC